MLGPAQRWDIRHIKKNGEVVWMRNTTRAVRYGRSLIILVTCEDIDDAYKLSEMLSLQSLHDELTGLGNRKALEQRLDQVIESAHARYSGAHWYGRVRRADGGLPCRYGP